MELRIGVDVDGAPLYGILDRLDRDPDGSLTIVDYKTGGLPNRNYDSRHLPTPNSTPHSARPNSANEPTKIRLMYVAHGESIERNVSEVVVNARAKSAARRGRASRATTTTGTFPPPLR